MESKETRKYIEVTPIPHLPQEIIEGEILLRLPVKSLLRFKCVLKTWRTLISSNGFIKAHLEKSSSHKSFEHHHIIFGNSIVQANQCFLPSFLHEPLATAVDFDYPMCGFDDDDHVPSGIIGSCNGLVCFFKKNTNDFILWNPSTRKFKQLPPIIDDDDDNCELWTAGFGFDEPNDDYKVFGKLIESERAETGLVKTYSLKTDSWRKVGVFPFDSDYRGSGTYVSGKLHWNRYGSDNVVRGIVSFDLENEIFGTVELPNGIERCFLGPKIIDGCLCCISLSDSKPDDRHADYWLLKEYGANDSCWHKFATLERPLRVTVSGLSYYDNFVPYFVGAGGDILCWNAPFDTFTILFKTKDGFSGSGVRDLCTDLPPVIYFESLVGL